MWENILGYLIYGLMLTGILFVCLGPLVSNNSKLIVVPSFKKFKFGIIIPFLAVLLLVVILLIR